MNTSLKNLVWTNLSTAKKMLVVISLLLAVAASLFTFDTILTFKEIFESFGAQLSPFTQWVLDWAALVACIPFLFFLMMVWVFRQSKHIALLLLLSLILFLLIFFIPVCVALYSPIFSTC